MKWNAKRRVQDSIEAEGAKDFRELLQWADLLEAIEFEQELLQDEMKRQSQLIKTGTH